MRSATLCLGVLLLLCAPPAVAGEIYFIDTATVKVQRANTDGTGLVDLVVSPTSTAPIGMTVDTVNQKVYWTDQQANNSRVMRADLDGSNPVTLVSHPTPVTIGFPYGVAVDPIGGKFYWADISTGWIRRANLDGSVVENLLQDFTIHAIAIDLVNSKLYFTRFATDSMIHRANLDGTNIDDLITTGTSGLSNCQGIALDVAGGKMYWTDGSKREIHRANLDGSGDEVLVSNPTVLLSNIHGIALDLTNGKMYWTDAGADKIQRANLDGSNVEDILTVADGLSFPRGLFVVTDPKPVPALQASAIVTLMFLLLAAARFRSRRLRR